MPAYAGAIVFAVLMPHAPVLVPSVGQGRVELAASTVTAMRCAAARLTSNKPQVLIVISPHSPRKAGAFGLWGGQRLHGDLEQFAAPEVVLDLPNDPALASEIQAQASQVGLHTWQIPAQLLDHGALVPLWFAAEAGWQGPTVIVSLNYPGEAGFVEFGRAVARAVIAHGLQVAVIASGDMSHRLTLKSPAGFEPNARNFDRDLITCLGRGEYRRLEQLDSRFRKLAAEDAVDSALVAAAAVNWEATGHEVLSYEAPFGVGYGVAVLFDPPVPAPVTEGPLLANRGISP